MKKDWTYKKLGEVAEIEYGTRVVQKQDGGSIYPVYGGGGATFKMDTYNREDRLVVARFAMSPKCTRFVTGKFFLNDSGLTLKAGDCLLTPYLNWHVIYHNDNIYRLSKGAAQKNLDVKAFLNLPIHFPPISIQESIVRELDAIHGILEKKQEQLRELDNLAQAIFYDMFGNEEKWEQVTLNDVFSLITDGTHQTPTYTEDKENGVKFLSAKNVTSGVINWTEIKYIPKELHDILQKRLSPRRNDILLCKNGTTGICALVETDDVFDIYVSLALLRPKENILPIYLVHAINSPATKEQFDGSLKGVGVPNLHLGEIKKAHIPLPPLSLQQSFAAKIEAIEAQKQAVQQSIREIEALLAERMDYYFS